MKISQQDSELFFKLMSPLLHYVNLKLSIFPKVDSFEKYEKLNLRDKLEIRDKLYERIDLLDQFIVENPDGLSGEEFEILAGWKKFVKGKFFIERYLKKYSIFIDGDKVYAVLAVNQRLEDIIPKEYLPAYVEAVLLPFKGGIVYDGFLMRTNMFFGSGYKFSLKEAYMSAKQKGQIIESFDPEKQAALEKKLNTPAKDYRPILSELSEQAKQLRSSGSAPAVYSPAFSLAKAGIDLACIAVETPDDLGALWKAFEKIEKLMAKAEIVLHRME